MKKNIILFSVVLYTLFSCQNKNVEQTTDSETHIILEKILDLKKQEFESFVAKHGNRREDTDLLGHLIKALNSLKGNFSDDEKLISSRKISDYRKESLLKILPHSKSKNDLIAFKIALVDTYYKELIEGYYLFDMVKPVAIRYGKDSLKVFLQAGISSARPNIYLKKDGKAILISYESRINGSPTANIDLTSIEFGNTEIESEKNDYCIYQFPSEKSDVSIAISENDVVNIR